MTGWAPAPDAVDLHLVFSELRSDRGLLRFCVSHTDDKFPSCADVAPEQRFSVAAAATVGFTVHGVRPGHYAVAAIHDENGNARLDKSLVGMPIEGIGFSRNPKLVFGPPKFASAEFDAATEPHQTIRMKYYL